MSADRREIMSPTGGHGHLKDCSSNEEDSHTEGEITNTHGGTVGLKCSYITCMVLIKKGNFLPHQSSEQMIPEPQI